MAMFPDLQAMGYLSYSWGSWDIAFYPNSVNEQRISFWNPFALKWSSSAINSRSSNSVTAESKLVGVVILVKILKGSMIIKFEKGEVLE